VTWIVFYLGCGIAFAHFFRIRFLPVYFCALILLITCVIFIKRDLVFKILFPCFVFILGALLLLNSYILPKSHISHFIFYKNDTVFTVKGFISSQPQLKEGKPSFLFRTEELEFNSAHYKCSGDILVYLKEAKSLAYGEAFILRGAIHKPFKLYGDRVSGIMRVNSPICAVSLGKNCGHPLLRLAYYLRNNAEAIIYRKLSRLAAGILDAMVLGEKSNIPFIVYDSMSKAGTVHILVVSGFNVGVVASIAVLLLKVLGISRRIRCFLAILCLIIYCFATGVSSPVVRATIMAVFLLAGLIIKREADIRNSLALAALCILFLNPRDLFSISFQLSFSCVAAIVFLYPKLQAFFRSQSIRPKILQSAAQGCLVSLSTWLVTLWLVAYYFRFFSPVTVLANIFIVPLATLITLCGFSLVIVALVFPSGANFFVPSIELFVALLINLNNFFIRLPFAYLYL